MVGRQRASQDVPEVGRMVTSRTDMCSEDAQAFPAWELLDC